MAAIASGGGSDGGNLFGEIVGKGLQTGLGTIAGLGYGCVFIERITLFLPD
jgi:26S proteasome regulatory subunit T1